MASLHILETEREAIRGQLFRFKNFLDSNKSDKRYMMNLNYRLLKMEASLDKFHSVQTKIESLNKLSDPSERALFEELYYDLISRAQLVLSLKESYKTDLITFEPQENQQEDLNDFVSYKNVGPQFSNDESRVDISNIEDAMKSSSQCTEIHYNESLRKNQKYSYMKCLPGEEKIFESIETCEDFGKSWSVLHKRFDGDERLTLLNSHIKALHGLPNIKNGGYESLKKFYASIKEHTDAIKVLGQDVDAWNILIIEIAQQKLDTLTHEEWKKIKNKSSIDTFINFLADRCRFFEPHHCESNQDVFSVQNEKSQLLLVESNQDCKFRDKENFGKCSCGKNETKIKKEVNSDYDSDSDEKKDKKKKKKKRDIQGGILKICIFGTQAIIRSLFKKMLKILGKTVFKFFVKAYLKWQVVTPMSIQLV